MNHTFNSLIYHEKLLFLSLTHHEMLKIYLNFSVLVLPASAESQLDQKRADALLSKYTSWDAKSTTYRLVPTTLGLQ